MEPCTAPDSQTGSKIFSVRIVSIDYYMAPPIPDMDFCYSSFQGEKVNEVPVVRVYGSTPAGQKTCLHVHQALPYLYVPCADIPLHPTLEGDAYAHSVCSAMEKALKLKANAGVKRQHVHCCNLVRARRFYGYHASEELFVKIYLYYPHDVPRAAKLLLGGAVFDKRLQPHESHIPYLLQFLIDYNLYGMGHLHLVRMKFRHPIPDFFTPNRFGCDGQRGQLMAESGSDAHSETFIWISSTIPGGWSWQPLDSLDASTDAIVHGVRRQSTCELEGDASVDDIFNQHFKMYTSLSQACSDVKMVQSLVPIWEEEFERSGMHEAALHPDPGKPLPVDVLKVLSLGLELECKLKELCRSVEGNPKGLEQNVRTIGLITCPDYGCSPESTPANYNASGEFLQNLKEGAIKSSSALPNLPCGNKMIAMTVKAKDDCDELSNENGSSHSTPISDGKGADKEVVGLLKWLATSQAAEDLSSDDELVREIILSPLLPATTMNEVLEKANLDYEEESQKECQDILDSIEDLNVFDGPKERTNCSASISFQPQVSPEKRIPQVDGSSDDCCSSPGPGWEEDLPIMEKKGNKFPQQQVLDEISKSHSSKKRRNSSIWGSLPFSTFPEVNPELKCLKLNDGSVGGTGDQYLECSDSSNQNRSVYLSDTQIKEAEPHAHLQESKVLKSCSLRDMMREKRRHIFRPFSCPSHAEKKADVVNCSAEVGCHELHDEEPSLVRSCPDLQRGSTKACQDFISPYLNNMGPLASSRSESTFQATMPHGNVVSSVKHGDEVAMLADVGSGRKARIKGSLSTDAVNVPPWSFLKMQNSSLPLVVNEINKDEGWISSVKVALSEDSPSKSDEWHNTVEFHSEEKRSCQKLQPADAPCCTSETSSISESETSDGPQGNSGRGLDEFPPLLDEGREDKGGQGNCTRDIDSNCHQGVPTGVPTHYLNDGSCLYLVTPEIPPPSTDSVNDWLSCFDEGISQMNSGQLLVSSPVKGFSGAPLHSQETSKHVVERITPKAVSSSFARPIGRINKEKHQKSEMDSVHSDMTTALLNEETNARTESRNCSLDISQISGPERKSGSTPLNQLGFRDPASCGAGQQLTLLSMEVQAESRGDLRPDPRFDAINILALAIMNDVDSSVEVYVLLHSRTESCLRSCNGVSNCKVLVFSQEKLLLMHFAKIISKFDPDILMGWDVQGSSLGYLAERASYLGTGLLNMISRVPTENKVSTKGSEHTDEGILENVPSESLIAGSLPLGDGIIKDEWGRTHASGVHVGGRIVLNIWRLMQNEVKHTMYTLEAIAELVLRKKVPSFQPKVLTKWFSSGPGRARYRCVEYMIERAKLNLEIMNQLDLVNRTAELARVFGIDFFSVLSRGSQYRVESMLLRLAHTQNYVAISPGNQQVASQSAMECLPLVMEPESGFYADPVIVLDFQSLYPSMIIAYNLCFCTCLGKVSPSNAGTLGVTSFTADPHILQDLKEQILLTPNGVMYVPPKVRRGILPHLLEEILSTRIMVKQAMKRLASPQRVLYRIFNARQLALKLIANVTYGYTAAGFSGRMPCAELADSIVQCGRRTLESAISLVNGHDKWKAKVIYGDTDSMFVLLKGRTRGEAFQIGSEIVSAVNAMNPNPVALKMEKVYHPCFLLTKKRYVGYSYESPEQMEPVFDAKGIETVRRDTCRAVTKTMEQSLRMYFENQNISEVKAYLYRQWTRILSGRVPLQDFVFAKEVRLGTYSTRTSSSLPPAAIVATKAMRIDPRAEPRYAERIPYVVVHGEPGSRLVDMVVDPMDVLAIDSPFRLNELYYIKKQIIPALQRVFGLVGADLSQWFSDMPRPTRENFAKQPVHSPNPKRKRIDFYYLSKHCIICGELVPTSSYLCDKCIKKSTPAATTLIGRTSRLEREMQHLAAICRHCGGGDWILEGGVKCTSLACPVFYERRKVQKELQGLSAVANEAGLYPRCMVEWF